MGTMIPSTLAKSFNMINPEVELKVTIHYVKHSHLNSEYVGCYADFELLSLSAEKNDADRITLMKATGHSNWNEITSVGYSEDLNHLVYFSLVGSCFSGFTIRFKDIEISGIDFKEGNNLLEFFKKMSGIKLCYQADVFGFLRKNGKDKTIIFLLPYLE